MIRVYWRHRKLTAAAVAVLAGIGLAAATTIVYAQRPFEFFLFAVDKQGVPVVDLKETDLSMKEDAGQGTVTSVRRFGWTLKVTVLLDNGPKASGTETGNMLQHARNGLKKFVEGVPRAVPISLLTTAPTPRFLARDETDPAKLEKAIGLIVQEPADGSYGRFSDSLVEYAFRLEDDFRKYGEGLPPYLPVLVVISTTTQDGSLVRKEDNIRMITTLRKYRVWTNLIMVTPSKPAQVDDLASIPTVEVDEVQIGEIATVLKDNTDGRYFPVSGSGTTSLNTKLLPDLARDISARYIKQMFQHKVVVERAAGATGPIKNLAVGVNREGVQYVLSLDPNQP
jgi:hypothetical protein